MAILSRTLIGRDHSSRPDSFAGDAQTRNGLAALWIAAVDALAPLGYEDAEGFHFGPTPAYSSHPD